jgi:diadenosine tetraphosphatase ApaH/serine/threonine PP2A family protein phosphatase
MLAVISDIHANYEALSAVFEELKRLEVETVICLGDLVGYGPQPVECVDAVRERCEVTLCGNHDFALVYGADDFNPVARSSLDYHRRLLMPRFDRPSPKARERWEFMKNLPKRHVRGEMLFVHASPRNPVCEYLRKIDVLLGMSEKLNENFAQVDWLCFVGHTHRAGVITQDLKFLEPDDVGGTFRAQPHQKAIINPGSVGQPRDRDSRAAFITLTEEGEITFRRVAYDVKAVAAKMAAMPEMDPSLAERLRKGQ